MKRKNNSRFQKLEKLIENQVEVEALLIQKNGNLISGDKDGIISIWDVDNECKINTFKTSGVIWTLALLANDELAVGGGKNDKTIKIWSLNEGKLTKTLEGHNSSILALACLNGNRKNQNSFTYESM